MKKLILLLCLAALLLQACGRAPVSAASAALHPDAQAYLAEVGAEKSCLLRLRKGAVKRYRSDPGLLASYDDVFRKADLIHVKQYPFEYILRKYTAPIQANDYVTLSVKVKNVWGKLLLEEQPFPVLLGCGLFNLQLEKDLVGHQTGDVLVYKSDEIDLYRNLRGRIEVTVEKCEMIRWREGCPNLSKFYPETVKNCWQTVREDDYLCERERFLDYAFGCASFRLEPEEVLALAKRSIQEWESLAALLGMTLEEYADCWYEGGFDAFIEDCYADAENAVRAALLLGVLAGEELPGPFSEDGDPITRYRELERSVLGRYFRPLVPVYGQGGGDRK